MNHNFRFFCEPNRQHQIITNQFNYPFLNQPIFYNPQHVVYKVERNEKPNFLCLSCNKVFKSQKTLNYHHKTQHMTFSKQFQCNLCDYQTKTHGSLKKHKSLQHAKNLEKYKCDICHYESKQKCHLIEHLKQKHGIGKNIKEYHCKKCSYKTRHHGSMKRHSKIHMRK